jgi:hypothetical protein
MISLVDVELRTIEIRLQGITDSIRRSRKVFLVTTIISVAIVVVCWNAYLSWYRGFALKSLFAGSDVTELAQRLLVEAWVDSQWVSIGLLGIRVGVSDVAVLGSLGLLVSSVWFFFAVRRENHGIGTLLDDTQSSPEEIREMVFYSITSALIFVSRRDDRPHGRRRPAKAVSATPAPKAEAEGDRKANWLPRLFRRRQRESFQGLRWMLNSTFFLPAVAAWAAVVTDLLSLFVVQAAFREPHTPLLVGQTLQVGDITKLTAMMGLAILMALLITRASARIFRYQIDMEEMINAYQDAINFDPPAIDLREAVSEDQAGKLQTWLVGSEALSAGTSRVASLGRRQESLPARAVR